MIANTLRMENHDRTRFLLQVASLVEELSIRYGTSLNIAEDKALAVSRELSQRSRELARNNIGTSAAFHLVSLFLEAIATPGVEADKAQIMCEQIFERIVAKVAAIVRDMG